MAKKEKINKPLAYVAGFKEFLGCRIDLSKKPLIPRPETEYWAGIAINEIKNSKIAKPKCLDVFAGSGCIGVAVLANCQNVLCDIAEKDKKLILQIKINLKKNFIRPSRCNIVCSDVFSKIKGKYDFILANPPYVKTAWRHKVQKSVLKYEPKMALFAGKDGLLYIKKFLNKAKKHLNRNGKIFMEFSPEQKKGIERLLKSYKYKKWEFKQDQFGRLRWLEIHID